MFPVTSSQSGSVLVVGAGPTGCTLALLLGRLGIPVTIIEQNGTPQQHPAACILNTRTMEIFRGLGLADEILSACQDIFEQGNITWVVSLAGRELGRCRVAPNPDSLLDLSPTHTVKFPQHKLEPLLWRELERQPNVAFRRNQQLEGLMQAGATVTATLRARTGGQKTTLATQYVVGCDGASSTVRGCLGIPLDGSILQDMIGIHFWADLGAYVSHRPSILYWILNPELLGVLIAHCLPTEWVLFAPYFPPQEKAEHYTESLCRKLIETATGEKRPDIEIKQVRPWTMSARLARTYGSGRVFLAGDAAHSFPPTGGLGLNTGVQDAHNLAWKLAAVLKRQATPELLATYDLERRPVARTNMEHSVRNFQNMNQLTRLAGVDWRRLPLLNAAQNFSLFRLLPKRWQLQVIRRMVRHVLKKLRKLDVSGVKGDRLRARFRELLPGQEPHYRFLGLDLGFAYRQGAVVPEPSLQPLPADPIMNYLPTTWPGARLPHFWLWQGEERFATHDLLKEGFILFIHPEGQRKWDDAARSLRDEFTMPLQTIAIGQGSFRACEGHDWKQLSEIESTGAVLVRPDGHVAWRCRIAPSNPATLLRSVLLRLNAAVANREDA